MVPMVLRRVLNPLKALQAPTVINQLRAPHLLKVLSQLSLHPLMAPSPPMLLMATRVTSRTRVMLNQPSLHPPMALPLLTVAMVPRTKAMTVASRTRAMMVATVLSSTKVALIPLLQPLVKSNPPVLPTPLRLLTPPNPPTTLIRLPAQLSPPHQALPMLPVPALSPSPPLTPSQLA
jgi:hypothetical protein